MEIILVHWPIKEGKAEEFEKHWKMMMNVEGKEGFYREILTKPVPKPARNSTHSALLTEITTPISTSDSGEASRISREQFEKRCQKHLMQLIHKNEK